MVNFSEKQKIYTPGEKIAGYTVRSRIGSGSFGTLYLVKDITGAVYALKILHGNSECEFAALQKMRQLPPFPGLTAIHAAGRLDDGCIYYLMDAADNLSSQGEYVPDTLANRLARQGHLGAAEVLMLGVALLPAIQHLHKHGVAHHDIKPENIIFIHDRPLLADFGSVDSGDAEGHPASSRGFYPPEELTGTVNGHFSPKNDLYALGMTLYCAWSGHAPEDFPLLPDNAVPVEIGGIRKLLLRACDPEPAYRFQTAEEFLKALLRTQNAAAGSVRRKRKIICWTAIAVFCIALLIAGLLAMQSMKEKKEFQENWKSTEAKVRLAEMAEDDNILPRLKAANEILSHEEAENLKIPENIQKFQNLHDLRQAYLQWRKTVPAEQKKSAENLIAIAKRCPFWYKNPIGAIHGYLWTHKELSAEEQMLLKHAESVCGKQYKKLKLELAALQKRSLNCEAKANELQAFREKYAIETACIDIGWKWKTASELDELLALKQQFRKLKQKLK